MEKDIAQRMLIWILVVFSVSFVFCVSFCVLSAQVFSETGMDAQLRHMKVQITCLLHKQAESNSLEGTATGRLHSQHQEWTNQQNKIPPSH